jgi:NAD(P)H-hydrate epimerase
MTLHRVPDAQTWPLYGANSSRAIDRRIIEASGISGLTLMQRAGAAAFEALRMRWPEARSLRALCGGGNNGGDGYIVARLALQAGWTVGVTALADPSRLKGEALAAFQNFAAAGGSVTAELPASATAEEVWVDALLGTGLDREVGGAYAAAIDCVNASGRPVLALDIPSGLCADTGAPLGRAVRAAVTVTFITLKAGLFTGQAADFRGALWLADLDAPSTALDADSPAAFLLPLDPPALPRRPRCAHKGHFGHVLIVGGDHGFSGAVRLAAEAAARSGAGLVSVATRAPHAALLNLARPELMVHGVEHPEQLAPLLAKVNAVAIGPGLGQSDWGRALLAAALESGKPLVLDADALNLLAKVPQRREDWVLTPHPGEAARLLGTTSATVQSDRFAAIARLRQRFGGVIVLKGAGTLILGDDEIPRVCAGGNPGMASGGMGDVLTGVIAAVLAQGWGLSEAATLGVRLHAAAADRAAESGERGLLAGDVMERLRGVVNS